MPRARKPKAIGHDGDGGGAQALRDVVADGAGVAVGGGPGDPRQQRGHHGDGDDRLRHVPDQLRVGVRDEAGARVSLLVGGLAGPGGELGDDSNTNRSSSDNVLLQAISVVRP